MKKLGDFLAKKIKSQKFKKGLQYAQAFRELREEIESELSLKPEKVKQIRFEPSQNKGLKVICPDRMWAQEIRLNSSSLLERLKKRDKKWVININSLEVTTERNN